MPLSRQTPRNFRNIRRTAVKLTTLGVSTTDVRLDVESGDGAEGNRTHPLFVLFILNICPRNPGGTAERNPGDKFYFNSVTPYLDGRTVME